MLGKAKELKVKTFFDCKDADVELKLNKFFEDNPEIIVVDIKYINNYLSHNVDNYGYELAMVVYKEN